MTDDTTREATAPAAADAPAPGHQTVLLVGGTGMLGGPIATHLLKQPDVQLRLLVRPGALDDPAKRANLESLLNGGATAVAGELADAASLAAATRDVDAVVSVVQGGRNVIVDGQIALAEAAVRSGVRRMLPSDFALDVFKATPGEHASFDFRREADAAISQLDIEHVHVLTGALIDGFVDALFDHDARTVTYWGSGEEQFDATSVEATAQYTALAAVDRGLVSGKLAFVGERISFGQMADAVEQATGRTYTRRSLGSVDVLRTTVEGLRRSDPHSMMVVMMQYQLYMLTGQTALDDPQNHRYPDIHPRTFAELARTALAVEPRPAGSPV